MVNENHSEFLKEQRILKDRYIGDPKDNRPDRTMDPEFNSRGNANISVGATGRDVEDKD